jgi:hypothetical protein
MTAAEIPMIQKIRFRFYFFKNALNKSIGSGKNVVVLRSLDISRMVWR